MEKENHKPNNNSCNNSSSNNDNNNSNNSSSNNSRLSEHEQEHEEAQPQSQEEEEEEEVVELDPPPPLASQSTRTAFINLSQVDADLALARTLQEQERAYMMLRMNNEGSDYGSWEAGSYEDEDDFDDFRDNDDDEQSDGTEVDNDGEEQSDGTEVDNDQDAFDVHAHDTADEDDNPGLELDPAAFSSDEAYARALQDAEDRDLAARLMALAGIDDRQVEDTEDHGVNSQDTWEEVDPDELSYEELLALGEVVGTESRGLSVDTIASLPSLSYKTGGSQNGSNESCVICRLEYEDGENLTVLSCKHSYHSECINNWLTINKVCPVCNAEVSTSGNS